MARLIFKTLFCFINLVRFVLIDFILDNSMKQKLKTGFLSQENEKNKHSNVKNVSFY